MTDLTVDIWSDLACPWCYIGKRKFELGLAEFAVDHPEAEVTVEFHSYQLSPDTPADFEGSQVEFLADHKGIDQAQVQAMLAQVSEIAASVGLDYDFDVLRPSNTLKAHQVIQLAKDGGLHHEVTERLFRAHFVEGRHLGQDGELAELAGEVGLDPDAVRVALASQSHLPPVQADLEQARAYGISGVPFFVLDDQFGISGAQDPATFAQALAQVWDQRGAAEPADPGSSPVGPGEPSPR